MGTNYDFETLVRFVLNEISLEERQIIEQDLQSDSELRKIVREIRLITSVEQKPFTIDNVDEKWNEVKKTIIRAPQEKQKNKIYRLTNKKNSKKQLRKRAFRIWRYVAAIVFAIGLSYYFSSGFYNSNTKKTPDIEYKTLTVNKGERKTIMLYDGTTINLDADSELKYPKKFGDSSREVYLKGEGFFQVAKNPYKPFYIHTKNALIEVVGTKFNIRSWAEDDKGVTVTVTEGKVALGLDNSKTSDKVYLTKNMQSSLSYLGKISKPVLVDPSKFTKWMHNEIYFQNASLNQVILQLERWYNLEFDVAEDLLNKKNLTVHLSNTNLNDVLELIATITKTKLERHGNRISFKK